MAQTAEEGVNRKNLELLGTKKKHVTETKPKQTNQTDDSFQKKHKSAYHTAKRKRARLTQGWGKKEIALTCKGSTPLDRLLLETKCCQQTETEKHK